MDLGLTGKVAIVTGSSRGIGKAIATGLAEEGCKVCICARRQERLSQTAVEIRAKGAEVLEVQADLTVEADIERLVKETVHTFGRVDILVNNVGGSRGGAFLDTADSHWHEALDINLFAAIRTSRLVIPQMKEQGGGAIIMIASIWGRESGGLPTYNAAKAAVISLAKSMARELAPFNIRVNSVAPGSILFPGGTWDRRVQADPQGMADFVKKDLPLGRFGRPEEVANVAVFLASERASLVTGACINVDGCQSRSLI